MKLGKITYEEMEFDRNEESLYNFNDLEFLVLFIENQTNQIRQSQNSDSPNDKFKIIKEE